MKINKEISVRLEFTESESSFFLAGAMFKYISEIDNKLENNIGFDENENTESNDFLYSYKADDLEIKSKIEKHIVEFEKIFNLIENVLEEKIESGEICDSDDFYDQFTKLYKIVNLNSKLDKSLDNKAKVSTKRKI